ncbi:molybdenum cofactor biosynthesis protein MoaE [Desulfurella sp.]|uniref:molybdenum cofactor biosynthesis protein MoaE n=1 Tax=Desulfurella sp. TaxID=1962857 RepID=UPI0025C21371|nr:molybdenum cofactor biosynthesis protein MoaE [Desulfurella sp.]
MKIPSIDEIIKKIKKQTNPERLGMILIHNGIVRKTSKDGSKIVKEMFVRYDKELLDKKIKELKTIPGIEYASAFINEGKLNIGDDIMLVIVAGDRRSNILKPFEDFIEYIKQNIVKEQEI